MSVKMADNQIVIFLLITFCLSSCYFFYFFGTWYQKRWEVVPNAFMVPLRQGDDAVWIPVYQLKMDGVERNEIRLEDVALIIQSAVDSGNPKAIVVDKGDKKDAMPEELKMKTLSYALATAVNGTTIISYPTLPLIAKDVTTNPGFVRMDERRSCIGSVGEFGYRYSLTQPADAIKEPSSVYLTYDESGIVAGIGSSFSRSVVVKLKSTIDKTGWVEKYMMNWMFNGERLSDRSDAYTVTAYFVDVDTICEKDQRSLIDLKENGFMHSLYLRNGSMPNEVKYIAPHKWETELKPTLWVKGGCTYQSGQYYWYNIGKTMDCLTFQPVFLLYDGKGVLTGFGWFVFGRYEGFEHPSLEELEAMFGGNMPQCVYDKFKYGVSVRHVFLKERGHADMCKSRK